MDASNIILNLPFDEGDGSLVAYDYSQSRADGHVHGAGFAAGKNGNAITFSGSDTCEVSPSVLDLSADFSMLMWVQAGEVEVGSPKQLIWLLNFQGLENYVEVPMNVNPGAWLSLALTRRGAAYSFYVNDSLVQTANDTGTLLGVSLNQDFYGGDYGLGLLDDVKFYNTALTQADLFEELSSSKNQTYLIDGVDFKEYGVCVSDSKGVVNRPKLKAPASVSWDSYHGEAVDLNHKFYEPREITLSCFIRAVNKDDFILKVMRFEQLFDKSGLQRLTIDVHPIKPLVYEVYCKDEISVTKQWSDEQMVGTFDLKLVEPEPVKRVLKHIRVSEATKTCTVTITTSKLVNIYWGDGQADFDVAGENISIAHDYADNGDFIVVVTGCIDEISKFETNAIVVWSKL